MRPHEMIPLDLTELGQQIELAVSARNATPRPLYKGDRDTFYPSGYFIRKLTMLRQGADGTPEVVPA